MVTTAKRSLMLTVQEIFGTLINPFPCTFSQMRIDNSYSHNSIKCHVRAVKSDTHAFKIHGHSVSYLRKAFLEGELCTVHTYLFSTFY